MAIQQRESAGRSRRPLYAWLVIGVGAIVAAASVWALLGRARPVSALAADLGSSDSKTRHRAARQLAKLGPEARDAVPQLAEALRDQDRVVRFHVAKALAEIGVDAQPAIPALIACLAEPDADTRYFIVKAISKLDLGSNQSPAVPGLVRLLKDENPKTRYYAAKCLKAIGPAAGSAIPALQIAAQDPDPTVKEVATAALKKVTKPN